MASEIEDRRTNFYKETENPYRVISKAQEDSLCKINGQRQRRRKK